MKTLAQALTELQEIVDKKTKEVVAPYKKGDKIRVGHYMMRPSRRHGHVIIDTRKNTTVDVVFSKIAGIALSYAHLNKSQTYTIKQQDSIIEKFTNDCCFYDAVIASTENDDKRNNLEIRRDDAQDRIDQATRLLDQVILSQIR